MRYVFLAIFVLLAAQPLQASFCDMCAGQKALHADMMSDDMSGDDMHAGMDHGNNSKAMDCCDDELADGDEHCAGMVHCGASPAGNAAVIPSISSALISVAKLKLDFSSDSPLYRSGSPPFRPPIS
jgi:hypothetical protein